MSRKYTTAMGKSVDMAALALKNEKIRAVGNMNVNARGDIIGSDNQIINDVTKRVNSLYSKVTANPGASARGVSVPVPGSELTVDEITSTIVASPPAKTARSKKTKVVEPELSSNEIKELDEFNEPNPKKES